MREEVQGEAKVKESHQWYAGTEKKAEAQGAVMKMMIHQCDGWMEAMAGVQGEEMGREKLQGCVLMERKGEAQVEAKVTMSRRSCE